MLGGGLDLTTMTRCGLPQHRFVMYLINNRLAVIERQGCRKEEEVALAYGDFSWQIVFRQDWGNGRHSALGGRVCQHGCGVGGRRKGGGRRRIMMTLILFRLVTFAATVCALITMYLLRRQLHACAMVQLAIHMDRRWIVDCWWTSMTNDRFFVFG